MTSMRRGVDRRIQRTRQILLQAFKEVAQEKGFAATSIQDIAKRANVNRGTFYHHFTDKYMLVDYLIREQFQQQLELALPASPGWSKENLRLVIRTVLGIFASKYRHQRHHLGDLAPLLERALYEELAGLLSTWLEQAQYARQGSVSQTSLVRVLSWAIFGSALEWSQDEQAVSLERMTDETLQIVTEGVARLAPDMMPG